MEAREEELILILITMFCKSNLRKGAQQIVCGFWVSLGTVSKINLGLCL